MNIKKYFNVSRACAVADKKDDELSAKPSAAIEQARCYAPDSVSYDKLSVKIDNHKMVCEHGIDWRTSQYVCEDCHLPKFYLNLLKSYQALRSSISLS